MTYTVRGLGNEDLGRIENLNKKVLRGYYERIKENPVVKVTNDEFLEVFGSDGERTNILKLRDVIHRDGDWHRTFHMHMYCMRGKYPFIFLQRRHPDKDVGANTLDTLVAGHYRLADKCRELAASRECLEEVGISIDTSRLNHVGIRKIRDQADRNIRNYELQDVFFYRSDPDFEHITLKRDEVVGVYRVNILGFIELLTGITSSIPNVDSVILNKKGESEFQKSTIHRDDIRHSEDHYHLKSAIIAYWLLKDESELRSLGNAPYDLVKDRYPMPSL